METMVSQIELPQELRELLAHARSQMLSHKRNDLIRPLRIQIERSLGPYVAAPNKPAYALRGVGLTRRTNLCIFMVERVSKIWDKHYPDVPAVQDMIQLARQRLEGSISVDDALDGQSRLVGVLQNNADEPLEKQPALSAGEAAVQAVYVAVYDEDMKDAQKLDDDLDAADWDCAFWAACAWSGAIPSQEGWSQQAYKEFWLWYLDEAVPRAWASA